uniref:Uncharacterized protein n=1 Tax=Rhizophora mucronata TaxID=61149 RepID=A0A2P2K6M7_RHIMU
MDIKFRGTIILWKWSSLMPWIYEFDTLHVQYVTSRKRWGKQASSCTYRVEEGKKMDE